VSRILLTWEMGSNLGHLSRLLPVARELKVRGHRVLVAARDVALAASVLGPAGIPFIQAPLPTVAEKTGAQPASYADLLRAQGWGDSVQLWALVHAWANLWEMFSPEAVVLDHSPTALLTARTAATPCALLATGFELPPAKEPLPAFPGFPGATAANAAEAEARVLESVNRVLDSLRSPRLLALRELFLVQRRWLTTFAELDHYGARPTEQYIGPIGEVSDGERVEWPSGFSERVFAYLRPTTPGLHPILNALAACGAAVVCWAPGVEAELLETLRRPGFVVASRPVHLRSLLTQANLCVSYSPAGTVASSLLHGVPQLLAPQHLEAQLTAHRVECMGAGITLRGPQTEQSVGASLRRLLQRLEFKGRAQSFALRYRGFDPAVAASRIVNEIELIASQSQATRQ
jgi:UDP:flavonoid glycosyltransferase YjiC (YdhE family)